VMKQSSSVHLDVDVSDVYPWVNDLSRFPEWMPLVHAAVVADGVSYVWVIELRARVGVFARSKRLRMRRTVNTESRVVFERDENDGKVHAAWVLEVLVDKDSQNTFGGCLVTMNLSYAGKLWTAGLLDKVLASQIDAGKAGLALVVQRA